MDMHVGVMSFLIVVKSILVLPGLELNLWGVSHTQTNLSPGAALLGQEALTQMSLSPSSRNN